MKDSSHRNQDSTLGIVCVIAAHAIWGVLPIYWHQVQRIDPWELVCHRVLGAMLILACLSPLIPRPSREHRRSIGRLLLGCGIASVCIFGNWACFIIAVTTDQVLEASLGYYLNPLVNVVLGVVVLSERLNRIRWAAIAVAAMGVAIMASGTGGMPWISLIMALSFGVYGLIKKINDLPVMYGLLVETTMLTPFALIYILFKATQQTTIFQIGSVFESIWILAAGPITVVPLALYAIALRRVKLSTMGVLQYIGPTLQFLVGAVVYHEPLSQLRIVGFGFVWIGSLAFLFGPLIMSRLGSGKRIDQTTH